MEDDAIRSAKSIFGPLRPTRTATSKSINCGDEAKSVMSLPFAPIRPSAERKSVWAAATIAKICLQAFPAAEASFDLDLRVARPTSSIESLGVGAASITQAGSDDDGLHTTR